jgi:hypothetical protein
MEHESAASLFLFDVDAVYSHATTTPVSSVSTPTHRIKKASSCSISSADEDQDLFFSANKALGDSISLEDYRDIAKILSSSSSSSFQVTSQDKGLTALEVLSGGKHLEYYHSKTLAAAMLPEECPTPADPTCSRSRVGTIDDSY